MQIFKGKEHKAWLSQNTINLNCGETNKPKLDYGCEKP